MILFTKSDDTILYALASLLNDYYMHTLHTFSSSCPPVTPASNLAPCSHSYSFLYRDPTDSYESFVAYGNRVLLLMLI